MVHSALMGSFPEHYLCSLKYFMTSSKCTSSLLQTFPCVLQLLKVFPSRDGSKSSLHNLSLFHIPCSFSHETTFSLVLLLLLVYLQKQLLLSLTSSTRINSRQSDFLNHIHACSHTVSILLPGYPFLLLHIYF